ncbi:MAG: DNA-binding protein [Clostridium sp.]|nr:DNA-binding protein [Clostridium sp.]
MNYLEKSKNPFAILTAKDISKDLHIGINQAYDLLKQNDFPSITIGKRKTVTLASYLLWKINKKGV